MAEWRRPWEEAVLDILSVLALFMLLVTVLVVCVLTAKAANKEGDEPPNLENVRRYSCTAHDKQVQVMDVKDGKQILVGDYISYEAEMLVSYRDKTPDWTDRAEFKTMKAAGTFCVDWADKMEKATKEAQEKAKRPVH